MIVHLKVVLYGNSFDSAFSSAERPNRPLGLFKSLVEPEQGAVCLASELPGGTASGFALGLASSISHHESTPHASTIKK